MPSQHDYLVDDDLREGLRRREPPAEIQLTQRYNRGRRRDLQITLPPEGGDYDRYDGRLLALLWALVGNSDGLHILSRQHGWTGPDPPDRAQMADALLSFLWMWGRDGEALEVLWTRRRWLPVVLVDGQVPDALLGYLWWRYRRPDARDELFRRYHLGGATDAAQDRALTLLLVIDRWDYERYPTLNSLLSVSAARQRIDLGRHHARAPRVDQQEAENAAAANWPRPETPIEERDYLETNVPLELRCLHKIRENSEDQPLDLTSEELDYLARRNLTHAGGEELSGPPLARERTCIIEWMARHPEPSEEQTRERFPWFRQSGLARQTRCWRLHWRADENDRLLSPLIAGGDERIVHLACVIQENMDELARRIDAAGRSLTTDDRGRVLLFAELVDAIQQLRLVLETLRPRNGRLASLGAWQTNAQAFLAAFPILAKLSACRRLVYGLLHRGFPAHELPVLVRLSDWLDGGQWLATFGREDRVQSDLFCRWLTLARERFEDDRRAALELLILWLDSTQEPGEPPRWLLDADRAWWLSHEGSHGWPDGLSQLANDLTAALMRGDWTLACTRAGVMFRRLSDCPEAAGGPGRELQDCLHRLSKHS